MKNVLFVALLLSTVARADVQITQQTASMSVYSDEQQTVYLIDGIYRADLKAVWQSLSPVRAIRVVFRNQITGKDMLHTYFARSRLVDGEARCEKFAFRPADEAARDLLLKVIAFGPCNQFP